MTDEALIRQLFVKVGGTPLNTAVMDALYAVEVDSQLHLPAMCALRVHDANAELTNSGPFDLGATLEVGVSDAQGRGETAVFKGEITGIEPDYQPGTVVDLTVRAYDRSHRLHRGVHAATYLNMSDSDIASQIARDAGLQADVDASSPTHDHVYQHGQTHMAFLRERARRLGYDLYVDDRTLYFKRPGGAAGQPLALEWGTQLRAFRPVLSLGEQVTKTQVLGWDPDAKREVLGEATTGAAAPQIGVDPGGQAVQNAFGEAIELAVRAEVASQSDADALAQALLDERDGGYVVAEGSCVGQPTLKAGGVVELSALGQRFNGRYRVTAATHVWDTAGDYVTHFRVSGRRSDTLRDLLVGDEEPRAPIWSAMVGMVTDIDDPDGLSRVKCKFPWLNDDLESDWARVVALGAGNERGVHWLPEVNDEVLVVFCQDDVARPLVIGGLWNGQDALPADADGAVRNGSVVLRQLVSRAGHKLVFSEENPALVRLETAGGHIILLDDDNAKVEITTTGGQKLALDDNARKVSLETSGQIDMQAGQNVTIKATGNMNLEATGVMTIKGATVQLNP